jgi:hypothetical protein
MIVNDSTDLLIFGFVVALRFLVPLWIPRYPLPAIIAALIIDGVDQTVFQQFTDLDLTNYQSYDKALDIYYLAIAYLATFRNWDNRFAFELSRFLYYYRLVGVVLFEALHLRALLLFFPNTFEYFFIFYEAVRLRWNPARMVPVVVLGAGTAIWVFIKVPQEYWIHIAKLDVTDELRANPVLIPILAAAIVGLVAAAYWAVMYRLPPADHAMRIAVEDPFGEDLYRQFQRTGTSRPIFDVVLLEKVILVSLICAIFSQILPDLRATTIELVVSVSILILLNTIVSEWLARRGIGWQSTLGEFGGMCLVNAGLALAVSMIFRDVDIRLAPTLFFLLLVTLLITLYDRFQPYYLIRAAIREGRISPTEVTT